MDKFWPAIISAVVTIGILVFNTKYLEPRREKRKLNEEQFQNFFAPLYVYIRRMSEHDFKNKVSNFQNTGEIILTDVGTLFTKDEIAKLVVENSRFVDEVTLNHWLKWQELNDNKSMSDFCKRIVHKHNVLSKHVDNVELAKIEKKYGIPGSKLYFNAYTANESHLKNILEDLT
ncbi:hypothetical protein ACDN41_26905 [Priestia aryabhattai]|uniref:hypothetical protein n=1 Tax=Priestia aryabhattai TaxID=412384 RepID=UPI003531F03B